MSNQQIESPSPDDIRNMRTESGLTQADASAMVHNTERAWRAWEAGVNSMPPGLWELFHIKVAQRAGGEA